MKRVVKRAAVVLMLCALCAVPVIASAADIAPPPDGSSGAPVTPPAAAAPAAPSPAGSSAAAAPKDSTDFPLTTAGLNAQNGGLFVSDPLSDYGFFPSGGESRYTQAAQNAEKQDSSLRGTLFDEKQPAPQAVSAEAAGLFANTPKYADGRFDEQSTAQTQNGIIAAVIIGLCVISFFCARAWSKYKSRKRLAEAAASKEES
ncbi:MAG: hypothetical protein FWF33_08205 [Clostridiales bacterium]|nr:hypothetical protein [Clostridiales bacterium]